MFCLFESPQKAAVPLRDGGAVARIICRHGPILLLRVPLGGFSTTPYVWMSRAVRGLLLVNPHIGV